MINLPTSSSQWEVSAEAASLAALHLAMIEDRQPELHTYQPGFSFLQMQRLYSQLASPLQHNESCRSHYEHKLKGRNAQKTFTMIKECPQNRQVDNCAFVCDRVYYKE